MKKLIVVGIVLVGLAAIAFASDTYEHQMGLISTVTADTITGIPYQWENVGDSLQRVTAVGTFTPTDSGYLIMTVSGEVELAAGQRLYIGLDDVDTDSISYDTGHGWTYISCPPEWGSGKFNMPFTFTTDLLADDSVAVDSQAVYMATGSSTDNIVVKNIVFLVRMISLAVGTDN